MSSAWALFAGYRDAERGAEEEREKRKDGTDVDGDALRDGVRNDRVRGVERRRGGFQHEDQTIARVGALGLKTVATDFLV